MRFCPACGGSGHFWDIDEDGNIVLIKCKICDGTGEISDENESENECGGMVF